MFLRAVFFSIFWNFLNFFGIRVRFQVIQHKWKFPVLFWNPFFSRDFEIFKKWNLDAQITCDGQQHTDFLCFWHDFLIFKVPRILLVKSQCFCSKWLSLSKTTLDAQIAWKCLQYVKVLWKNIQTLIFKVPHKDFHVVNVNTIFSKVKLVAKKFMLLLCFKRA